jgi:hypothetical protein
MGTYTLSGVFQVMYPPLDLFRMKTELEKQRYIATGI